MCSFVPDVGPNVTPGGGFSCADNWEAANLVWPLGGKILDFMEKLISASVKLVGFGVCNCVNPSVQQMKRSSRNKSLITFTQRKSLQLCLRESHRQDLKLTEVTKLTGV